MSREQKILRMNILGGINSYILGLGDEDFIDYWQAVGVPDAATEEDLEFIATDEELWNDCISAFAWIVEKTKKR